jgi:hypothetical protein
LTTPKSFWSPVWPAIFAMPIGPAANGSPPGWSPATNARCRCASQVRNARSGSHGGGGGTTP